MKTYFLGLMLGFVGLASTPGLGQIKPAEVEIWGLPAGTTPAAFIDQLNQRKETVCMAAIRPLGFPDVYVIGFENITLVTLRNQPNKPCGTRSAINSQVAQQLNVAWQLRHLHTSEFQMACRALAAHRAHDTATVRAIRQKNSRLRPAAFHAALTNLQQTSGPSFEQALAVLCSTAPDSLREKAVAQLAARLGSADQARQLFPYLRDADVGGQLLPLVRGFYRYQPPRATDWPNLLPELATGLNSPDPIVVVGLVTWLTEQQVPRLYAPQLLGNGALGQREILAGQHPDLVVFKQPVYAFLSYLAARDIQSEPAALAYLGQFGRR